jgi:predicted TIM-barrel fold metal-dependent hydrolase
MQSDFDRMRELPVGACDCHVHVFEPQRFSFHPGRSYTPGRASLEELIAFEKRLGIQRVVFVQPSPYGSDNDAMLEALVRLGENARGVAVIDPDTVSDDDVARLDRAGVRSVRVNLEAHENRDPDAAAQAMAKAARRIEKRGWSLQIFAGLPVVAALKSEIEGLAVPVVADHVAGARAELGIGQAGLDAVLEMMGRGKLYVKLSAPYRASKQEPDYDDLAPIAKALIAAGPNHVLWASDWPHTGGGTTGSDARRGLKISLPLGSHSH